MQEWCQWQPRQPPNHGRQHRKTNPSQRRMVRLFAVFFADLLARWLEPSALLEDVPAGHEQISVLRAHVHTKQVPMSKVSEIRARTSEQQSWLNDAVVRQGPDSVACPSSASLPAHAPLTKALRTHEAEG
mmetsp:Transcript_12731/g.24939  ORF Transcript_12731/g.24939 Transcript_12731/m.24939 type:complete len:130 (-) Transcript_12731:97-486(-)